jgi:DNA modification methylase
LLTSYYAEDQVTLYRGSAPDVLPALEPGSVDCVVTSPPYFWQRDYGADGQFGMEPTIDGFVDNLRSTFNALRSALAADGTVWLNLGDTYYSAKGRPHGVDGKHQARRMSMLRAVDGPGLGLPRKSLIGIPWRVALAMQADGWTLRSAIIWRSKTSEPEPSAHDRPWRTYEHLFLFSKSPRYWFDRTALDGDEDVWEIEPERNAASRGKHFATFPTALVRRCVLAGCRSGGTVLDPFAGSGTTGAVALDHGRKFVGIDVSSAFLDLAIELRFAQRAMLTVDGH